MKHKEPNMRYSIQHLKSNKSLPKVSITIGKGERFIATFKPPINYKLLTKLENNTQHLLPSV